MDLSVLEETTEPATLTDDERRRAAARHVALGVGRKDQIDDPESRRELEPQQDQDEQRRAQTPRGSHLFSAVAARSGRRRNRTVKTRRFKRNASRSS